MRLPPGRCPAPWPRSRIRCSSAAGELRSAVGRGRGELRSAVGAGRRRGGRRLRVGGGWSRSSPRP
ncbi:hypothetical protein E4K73_24505 [Streptomyces sp. IB201691-2A2]|nr:hypothetical protein E4K73_24505 [Streptomyces sp. IB201691-2A2]